MNFVKKMGEKKIDIVVVYCLCLIICFAPLMTKITGRVVADNMGCLRLALKLANTPCDFDSSEIPYYGQMYYVLFFQLFKQTNNPYEIYYFIIFINAFVRSVTGLFIYKMQINHLDISREAAIPLTTIAMLCYPGNAITRFSNELPLFSLFFFVLYFALVANEQKGKRSYIMFSLMFLIASYGLLIHTRWILFYVCLFVGITISDFIYYKRYVVLKLSPLIMAYAVIAKLLVRKVTKYLFGNSTIHNANLDISKYMQENVISCFGAFSTMVSNMYRLCILTYGLPILGTAICIHLLILFLSEGESSLKSVITSNQLIVLVSSFLSLFGSILGVVFYYGTPITDWINTGQVNSLISGLGYDRYYIMYAGAFIIVIYCLSDKIKLKTYNFVFIFIFYILFKFVRVFLYEKSKNYGYLYYSGVFNTSIFENVYITFFVVLVLFCIYLLAPKVRVAFLAIISAVNLMILALNIKYIPPLLNFEKSYDAAYVFFQKIDDTKKIDVVYSDRFQIQFALLDRSIPVIQK